MAGQKNSSIVKAAGSEPCVYTTMRQTIAHFSRGKCPMVPEMCRRPHLGN